MAGRQDQQLLDPAELSRIFARIAEQSQGLIADFLQQQTQAGVLGLSDSLRIGKAFMDMTQHILRNPSQLVNAQLALWQGYWDLWQHTASWWGQQALLEPPTAGSTARNGRHDFLFDFIQQSYLLTTRCLQSMVAQTEGLDEQTCNRLDFYTRQFVDAMAARHSPASNPAMLQKTLISGGDNLLQGLQNLLRDLEHGKNRLAIRQTDGLVGQRVATTPGAVIFQNELMQLLQYTPSTPQVWQRPLLMVPPWINKFYLLDLGAENSFIKWGVEQGFTVFVISWVNPGPEVADKDFADYLKSGPLAALDAIQQATGERSVNAVGYCLGGVLLACAAGYLAQRREQRLHSCTYLATLLDFEQPGELEVYIDEEELNALEREPEPSRKPTTAFNMLRANDLIWSYFVNNYLLGKEPLPFDLLYWNADSTRMPVKMHGFYLRNMYQNNLLREAGGISLLGKPIDLSKVKTPSYYLAAIEDHITPWRSVYSSARLFSGPLRFVLAGSGHIAGVINPPQANKYGYWISDQADVQSLADANAWLSEAERRDGSWWLDWLEWVKPQCGPKVAARQPGDGQLPVLEAAPGSYVQVR